MKTVVALDAASLAEGGPGVLDRAFIAEHTNGIEALLADLDATSWEAIEKSSGLPRADIENSSATSTPGPRASSSITAWALPSIATAPVTCSRSPIS